MPVVGLLQRGGSGPVLQKAVPMSKVEKAMGVDVDLLTCYLLLPGVSYIWRCPVLSDNNI